MLNPSVLTGGHLIRCIVLILLVSFYSTFSQAKGLVIRYLPPENPDQKAHLYFVDMLRLALEKTEATDGPFHLQPIAYYMVQARAVRELARGEKLDIYWTMTSQERESKLTPIRIPLLKGLLGYRIFIIRKQDQKKFSRIKSLNDLKRYSAGQGTDWPDSKILRSAGLKVLGITDYESIFPMLEKKRIDYFPRGVSEPWVELKMHGDKGLVVEETILLHYPAPVYFFLNNNNKKLAERIERGLQIAIDDGSFDEVFQGYPGRQAVFEKARLNKRTIFDLDNPLLTPETPIDEPKYWLDPFSIVQSNESK